MNVVNVMLESLSPVLAWYDPFGADVPLNFDNTHSLTLPHFKYGKEDQPAQIYISSPGGVKAQHHLTCRIVIQKCPAGCSHAVPQGRMQGEAWGARAPP